ncbi:MAG TPA: zf-HC2 domain-containing protein [Chloroflexota bacterium]|nr:zf-HC2 domain-containing protein [Chloroflexota bacterium]
MTAEANFDHVVPMLPAFINGTLDRLEAGQVRQHLMRCAGCRAELAAWEAVGDAAWAATEQARLPSAELWGRVWNEIDGSETPAPVAGALPRGSPEPLRLGARSNGAPPRQRWNERMTTMLRLSSRRVSRPIWGTVAAAALAGALILTPVGGYAEGLITIFQPKQIVAVPITPDEMQSLPDLADYGTVNQPAHQKSQRVTSAAAASAAAGGMKVLVPGALPSGVPTTATFEVIPGESGSFTFSSAKAQAAAAAKGKTLPAMPANIDGSSIQITTGPAVVTVYANQQALSQAASEARTSENTESAAANLGPTLIIGQTTAPEVKSTGVSVIELEDYLLAQPGISPDLANAIKAIGDPSSTLPIPIPVNKAVSHPVTVQGVQGLSVADSTGLGGGILWQKDGSVYGVAGTLPESQLVAIANSLH